MKKVFSVLLIVVVCTAGLSAAEYTDDAMADAQRMVRNEVTPHLQSLAADIGKALPDNAVIGSTWSDAYIGQLLGVPPHFGVGVSVGITRFPVSSLRAAIKTASGSGALRDLMSGDTLNLPTYNISAKIGGIVLPFDFGLRFSYIPQIDDLLSSGISLNYLLAGADLRYNLLESGIIFPDISLGASFSYLNGNIGYTADNNNSMITDYTSYILEVSAQVSKSFIIVTPYIGVSGIMDWTTVDITTEYSKEYEYGQYSGTVADKFTTNYARNSDELSDDFFTARVFGGLSFNLAILKIDLCGSYNFMTENWGANLGFRVQL